MCHKWHLNACLLKDKIAVNQNYLSPCHDHLKIASFSYDIAIINNNSIKNCRPSWCRQMWRVISIKNYLCDFKSIKNYFCPHLQYCNSACAEFRFSFRSLTFCSPRLAVCPCRLPWDWFTIGRPPTSNIACAALRVPPASHFCCSERQFCVADRRRISSSSPGLRILTTKAFFFPAYSIQQNLRWDEISADCLFCVDCSLRQSSQLEQ